MKNRHRTQQKCEGSKCERNEIGDTHSKNVNWKEGSSIERVFSRHRQAVRKLQNSETRNRLHPEATKTTKTKNQKK